MVGLGCGFIRIGGGLWLGKNSKGLSGILGNTPLRPTKDYSDEAGDGYRFIFWRSLQGSGRQNSAMSFSRTFLKVSTLLEREMRIGM